MVLLNTIAVIFTMVVIITTIVFTPALTAHADINRTIDFHGKLLAEDGSIVPDGNYNIQFKIYKGGDGKTAGNPSGTLEWTETYTNNNNHEGLSIKNGLLSVNLGSKNPFGDNVDWNSDKLWLSINVAGSSDSCTAFGYSPCVGDGEMTPMKQLTSAPYAMNAGAVGGLTKDDLLQINQGTQTDSGSGSSIDINKTGSGNLIQFKNTGSDVFAVKGNGDVLFGGSSNHTISLRDGAENKDGKNLTVVAGNGGSGSGGNGGNLILSGGSGSSSGVDGLVVINTPTYAGATTQTSSSDTNVTQSNIDSFGTLPLKASTSDITFTMQAPTLGTNATGRVIYITADSSSKDFTLLINPEKSSEKSLQMEKNSTVSLLWNGGAWTVVGGSGFTTLQDAYDNGARGVGGADILVNNTNSGDGLTIRDDSDDSIDGTLLQVQDSSSSNIFSINSNSNQYATNPGGEKQGASKTAFSADSWSKYGSGATITRYTTTGDNIASGKASVYVESDSTYSGVSNKLSTSLKSDTKYNIAVSVRLDSSSNSFSDFGILYSSDGSSPYSICKEDVVLTANKWVDINCTFTTPSSGITSDNAIVLGQISSTDTHKYYIDNLSVSNQSGSSPNVKIGGNEKGGQTTLFTLDKGSSNPDSGDDDAMLGSMYYNTTLGKVQCYQSDGWGDCDDKPDMFVTLSPEYYNSVMNGDGIGEMKSGLCSDSLNINDGSNSQPTICSANETYNFYNWSSEEISDQTKSIFVTYKLPNNFKKFVGDSTSLMSRTDSDDSNVNFQIYRNNGSGLTQCGSTIDGATGDLNDWQEDKAKDSDDPVNCGFKSGDSIIFRINMTTKNDNNAYISDLSFVYSSN